MRTEEGRFQDKLVKWLTTNNHFVVKYNASGISKAGVPDLLSCIDGHFVAIEVKKEKGTASELQKKTVRDINKIGIACVIRPSQFKTFTSIVDKFMVDMKPTRYDTFKKEIITKIGIE